MGQISITANGNSAALDLTEKCAHELRLRGTTLDPALVLSFEIADIGTEDWEALQIRDGEPEPTMGPDYKNMLIAGFRKIRAVVSNFGTSAAVTLTNVPLDAISETNVGNAIDIKKVLVEDRAYDFTNNASSESDNVTISSS